MSPQSVASRTLATVRSMSARFAVRIWTPWLGDQVGLVEDAVGAGTRAVEAVEQLLDLEPVLGRDVLHRGRQVAQARPTLASEVGAVLGEQAVGLVRSATSSRVRAASIFGAAAPIRRVRSSMCPAVASTAGRTVSADVAEARRRSPASRRGSAGPRPGGVDRLADLGDRVAEVAPLDRPEPDLLQDRVEEGRLDPLDDLAGDQRHGRAARRDDVDAALAGQARLDRDLDVLLELAWPGRSGSDDLDPGPERPSTSVRSTSTTRPASMPGDPDRAARRGSPGRRGRRRRSSACDVRKPGPSPARPSRPKQARQGDDDHQADPGPRASRFDHSSGSLSPLRAIRDSPGRPIIGAGGASRVGPNAGPA